MEDKSLNCSFLQATSEGAGYGLNGRQVIVSSSQTLTAPLRAQYETPDTECVILTDDVPTGKIICDLAVLEGELYQASKPLAIVARDTNDILNNPRLEKFPALREDLARTVSMVAPVFNGEAMAVVMKRSNPRVRNFAFSWHADFFNAPEKRVVTRCLSEHGTMIGMGAIDKSTGTDELGRGVVVTDGGHAGQGTYIMKGDTMHASPAVRAMRWLYVVQPKPSYWN